MDKSGFILKSALHKKRILRLQQCIHNGMAVPIPHYDSADDRVKMPVYYSYAEVLEARASSERLVMLIVLDGGYTELAINLYVTSLHRLNITNYIFICLDHVSKTTLEHLNIYCYLYTETSIFANEHIDGNPNINYTDQTKTKYGDAMFKKITHMKTLVILEALLLNYTVVIVDVDIVFFRNPLPAIQCHICDIAMQRDGFLGRRQQYNSGFYFVRPTPGAIALHAAALKLALSDSSLSNQRAICKVIEPMRKQRTIILAQLSPMRFPNGVTYFESQRRTFPKPCHKCIILHNNWMVGNVAKIHRFRSHGMWFVDTDQYYTSQTRKYLVYRNPIDYGPATLQFELTAFKNALFLGHILNRIIILPKFHCYGCTKYSLCLSKYCPLQTFISIENLDKHFKNMYRENAFLCHPWVPKDIKEALPETLFYISNSTSLVTNRPRMIITEVVPENLNDGPTVEEILTWFDSLTQPTIGFHNLYGTFYSLYDSKRYADFILKLNASIVSSDYRQYT